MLELQVTTANDTYSIYLGENLRHEIKKYLKKSYTSILIITDDRVAPLYLNDVKQALTGENVFEAVVSHGEKSKNIKTYYDLQSIAMEKNLDRKSLIIALGGGVIGDLAGFVAATFMRGIDYIQMPTTILAHDSSVGGKVAINHELGKNMIGSFYQPQAVIYDISTLASLPEHEVRSGFAELMKEAFIGDASFLEELLTVNINEVENEKLIDYLYRGIRVKANIVEQDEKETNIRKFLNFGHTLAHALENKLGYGKMTHGEAVAIGMIFALQLSEKRLKTSFQKDAYINWLNKNNYPIELHGLTASEFIAAMKLDKKTIGQNIQFVLLDEIASPVVVTMDENELKQELESFCKEWNTT